jgi:hypothetical protein
MKKTILSIAAMLMTSSLSMAQFTLTSTSLTFTGNTNPANGTHGQFYNNQPNNGGGTMYANNTCTTVITQGPGAAEVGGFDPSIHDPSSGGNPSGVTFFGGKLRTVYYGATCTENIPSLGFHTGTNLGDLQTTGQDIDLSDPANQVIQFQYRSDASMTLELQLFDAFYNTKLVGVPAISIVGDNAYHTVDINFSAYKVGDDASMAACRQVSLLYNSTTLSPGFGFSLANIKLGSVLVTGINNSTSVANTNLFPNPSTGTTTISGELKSVSDVKITLVDMLGQEVKVIAEERTSTINSTFDVSTLKKGIYSVVTNIDGSPSKSQMLVVR